MGKINFGIISPHPPLLIPEIGGSRIAEVAKTKKSLEMVSKRLTELDPDTIVFFTPHGDISYYEINIYDSLSFEGNFGQFGLENIVYKAKGDPAFARYIAKTALAYDIPCKNTDEQFLDHGIMVPLHFIKQAGAEKEIIPIAISFFGLDQLYEFGAALQNAVSKSDKKVAVVASADMSHRLFKGAPSGYNPNGKIFDDKLVELVGKNDVEGILGFDMELAEAAGQDAIWSIAMLLGALNNIDAKCEVLSYEGPFGVGYMVAKYEVN
mgnify:CR=1 FL=1